MTYRIRFSGLQLLFVPLGFPGFRLFNSLQINMYTTPPLAAMLLNSTALFIMSFVFEETYAGLSTCTVSVCVNKLLSFFSEAVKMRTFFYEVDKLLSFFANEFRSCCREMKFLVHGQNQCQMFIQMVEIIFNISFIGLKFQKKDSVTGDTPKVKVPRFDRLALALCHVGRFTQTFTFTALETIGTAYAMTIFAWTKREAVTYVAIAYSCMSVVEFGAYALFVFAKLDRW